MRENRPFLTKLTTDRQCCLLLTTRRQIVIESDSDYLKVVELQKEKSNLERIVGKQQIRIDYYETLIEMIKEHYQDDIEKKFLKK